jgi:7-cyano-7-deazaguanine reductase
MMATRRTKKTTRRVAPTMRKVPKRTSTRPSRKMETFPNPKPGRDYEIDMRYPEFTCLCPMTGQPDFATVQITYIPDAVCVELKSLRNYLWSFRNQGAFHEAVTNKIADDLIRLMQPRWLEVELRFQTRGGIRTAVRVEHSGVGE